jgi:hypothetical protein
MRQATSMGSSHLVLRKQDYTLGDLIRQLLHKPKEFFEFCGGLQSLFIILGIIGGSIWAACTFSAFRQTTQAQATLLQDELHPALSETIKTTPIPCIDPCTPSSRMLLVRVIIRNTGSRHIVLPGLQAAPLRVSAVMMRKGQFLSARKTYIVPSYMEIDAIQKHRASCSMESGCGKPLQSVYLAPGEDEILPYVVKLDTPGPYFITQYLPLGNMQNAKIDDLFAASCAKDPGSGFYTNCDKMRSAVAFVDVP